ncbi:MAG: hypothetical protein JRK53_03695 [Deltaproteobacteria bacterium]|nr:hypothetical protein [Deltaproteobacteria bacterium]
MRKQPENTLADLQGRIERITYSNEENGYTIAKLKDNLYRLATDIFGIGFVTADRIAEKLSGSGGPRQAPDMKELSMKIVSKIWPILSFSRAKKALLSISQKAVNRIGSGRHLLAIRPVLGLKRPI